MKNKIIFFSLIIFTALFFTKCASIVTPTGGPRDTTPPELVASKPENLSKNFNSKSFTIGFNEFIQLNNVEEQLIITPTLKKKPDVRIKGKSIVVRFEDTLSANTTYTFNFGESIRDITEANTASNFKYIFSTGSYIDSSKISGLVVDAYSEKPVKSITVMLYKSNIDSVPLTKMPDYITKTNPSGKFLFTNVKPGKYKVFAINDKNSNFIFDQPTEIIAFADTVVPTADTLGIDLSLRSFVEELKLLKLMKKNAVQYGKVELVFNKPYESLTFKDLTNANDRYIYEPGVKMDTMTIWLRPSNVDSLYMVVYNNQKVVDTIELKLKPKDPQKNRRGNVKEVVFALTPLSSLSNFELNRSFELLSFSPIESFDPNKAKLICEKDTIKQMKFHYNDTKSKIFIDYNWLENTEYQLEFEPNAFTDILGLSSDTLIYKFKTRSLDYYAQLSLDFPLTKLKGKSLIIQLLNDKEQVVFEKEIDSTQKINLTYQQPGKYKLKAIVDDNKNSKWDVGNYNDKRQPEKVLFYKEEILLRSNWEVEVKWEL